ncbi:MAG: lysophospholipase [Clostridia bacterium]|jgi:alpha-beta hydrolase superfamily lysophospholipase
MKHREYQWQTMDGLFLHGREWRSEGPVKGLIGLIHGLGEHSGRYGHLAAYLTEKGYAILSFDLRGHGKSQGIRGYTPSYEALMQDIDVFMDQASRLFPQVPLFFYGHSLGGNLVLNYILRRQPAIRGGVATGPALRLGFPPPTWKIFLGRLMRHLWPTLKLHNGLPSDNLHHNTSAGEVLERDPLNHDFITPPLGIGMTEAGMWALDHAHDCSVPLLLMHGGADRITSPEATREFAEKVSCECTLKIWDHLYHEIHNEPQKEMVFDFLVNWLDSRLPEG